MSDSQHTSKNYDEKIFFFRYECGIEEAALEAGLNKPFKIKLARKELGRNGARMFAITNNSQLKLELSSIINGSDTLQGKL